MYDWPGRQNCQNDGYQPTYETDGLYDDCYKHPETQPHRTALYLRSKTGCYLHKNAQKDLPGKLEHYCDPNDYNRTFYYNNDSETDHELKAVLEDADELLSICGAGYDDVTEYQLLVRCRSEQTVLDGALRRLRTKEDGGLHSGMLQNHSDPDATFRTKAGKAHQGYAANFEEAVLKT